MIKDSINRLAATLLRFLAIAFVSHRWRELDSSLVEICEVARNSELGALPAALICAEDRRFLSHGGIDVIGITRAIVRAICGRKLEGASTITQQLVRTVTGEYQVSIRRKIREIFLAVLADAKFKKEDQIAAYLHVAYFGWRMNGIDEAMNRLGTSFPPNLRSASQIVARLKYPQPQVLAAERARQIDSRAQMISRYLEETTNVRPRHEVRLNRG